MNNEQKEGRIILNNEQKENINDMPLQIIYGRVNRKPGKLTYYLCISMHIQTVGTGS